MATIKVSQAHSLGLDEAKNRAHELLDKFQKKLSSIIKDVSWDASGTRGKATGKIFSADFLVAENEVSISVELKGLGGKMMAPKVRSDLEKTFAKTFG